MIIQRLESTLTPLTAWNPSKHWLDADLRVKKMTKIEQLFCRHVSFLCRYFYNVDLKKSAMALKKLELKAARDPRLFELFLQAKKQFQTQTHHRFDALFCVASIQSPQDVLNYFEHTPESLLRLTEHVLSTCKARQNAILECKEKTWENTVLALDHNNAELDACVSMASILLHVHPEECIRNAADDCLKRANEVVTAFGSDPRLLEAFRAIPLEGRSEKERYFLTESIASYVRSGFGLDEETRKRVQDLNQRLGKLTQTYSKAIYDDTSSIEASEKELEGLDVDFLASLAKAGTTYTIPCNPVSHSKIMRLCPNAAVRERYYKAAFCRVLENKERLAEILRLRDEKAKLLGFENYAAYNLAGNMAKTPQRVRQFLGEVVAKCQAKAQSEFDLLCENLPDGVQLDENGRFKPWDITYAKECYQKKLLAEIADAKEYFPLGPTIDAMLHIYEELLGVRLIQSTLPQGWHESVRRIEIRERGLLGPGKLLGTVLLDPFPRPNKYNHFCHSGAINAWQDIPSLACLICNFAPPSENKPSLLEHHEVQTFFHEFGHALHNCLGRQPIYETCGISVKGDFVELPSQLLEQWIFDPRIISRISSHYETKQKIPLNQAKKIAAAHDAFTGLDTLRQMTYATLSLELHESTPSVDELDHFARKIERQTMPFVTPWEGSQMLCTFGHLTGYAASYYGYMWSNVFAFDIFSRFHREGIMNKKTAKDLAKSILKPGGSADPNDMLRVFLGREPQTDAFFERFQTTG